MTPTALNPTCFVIDIPLPLPLCSPNSRAHHMAKSRDAKQYRQECWAAALNVKAWENLAPLTELAVVDQEWFMGPSKSKRVRPLDEDNCRACLKSAMDGIKDSGLIQDDTSKYITWGTFMAHRTKKEHGGNAFVRLTFRVYREGL